MKRFINIREVYVFLRLLITISDHCPPFPNKNPQYFTFNFLKSWASVIDILLVTYPIGGVIRHHMGSVGNCIGGGAAESQ